MELFTITEMKERFGVTARTLRFYETKGLVAPQRDGMRRLYSPADIRRLDLILRAKRYGLTLTEIHDLINSSKESQNSAKEIYAVFERQLAQLESEYTRLGQTIEALRRELAVGAKELGVKGLEAA